MFGSAATAVNVDTGVWLCELTDNVSACQISKKEERMLREWMTQIVGHDLSFKEFTLALKQRAALTSPQRISILKVQAQQQ